MDKHILIVEDEESIARGLQLNLSANGHKTTIVSNGREAVEKIASLNPDIVLLDVMLPGIDGFEVCRRVRATGNRIPILFLTALSKTDDRIRGLELGGDDYITKPFDVRELILRINAILRRQVWYSVPPQTGDVCEFGHNRIDFSAYKAETEQGDITLTQKEVMLLRLLIDNKDTVVTRDQVIESIWGYEYDRTNRTIDNLILRLRKYFETDPKKPKYILTQYGAGYKFVSEQ